MIPIRLISHRGNTTGSIPARENTIKYISEALKAGYDVEIDVTLEDNIYYLGHDKPQEKIDIAFLENARLWVHCKTDITHQTLYKNPKVQCFQQTDEDSVFTSVGMIWSHSSSKKISPIRILTILGPVSDFYDKWGTDYKIRPYAVCSDYVESYKELNK